MKNSGIKCEIGVTYEKVERLNTYLEKSVNGADQLHIVAGVHDKQATTFSGKVYNKDNAPMVTNVHYPIEFDTDKVALIDLRVNKMYTDEFGHDFIKCRSLTEESLRKIVFAMQREIFGIVDTDSAVNKVNNGVSKNKEYKQRAERKEKEELKKDNDYRGIRRDQHGYIELNCKILETCKSEEEYKLFSNIHRVKEEVVDFYNSDYTLADECISKIIIAVGNGITSTNRVSKRLNIPEFILMQLIVEYIKSIKDKKDIEKNKEILENFKLIESEKYKKTRQAEGIAIAKANGAYKGRKPIDCPDFDKVYEQVQLGVISATQGWELLGISKSSWYRRVRDKQQSLA